MDGKFNMTGRVPAWFWVVSIVLLPVTVAILCGIEVYKKAKES